MRNIEYQPKIRPKEERTDHSVLNYNRPERERTERLGRGHCCLVDWVGTRVDGCGPMGPPAFLMWMQLGQHAGLTRIGFFTGTAINRTHDELRQPK